MKTVFECKRLVIIYLKGLVKGDKLYNAAAGNEESRYEQHLCCYRKFIGGGGV